MREGLEVLWRNREGVVGVVAVLRRDVSARVVVREAEPEIAASEVRPGVPAGMQLQAEDVAPEDDAGREIADGEGEVVEGLEHGRASLHWLNEQGS